MRRKLLADDDGPKATWLTTYSDMVTLLMCFFILLFSLSVLNTRKFLAAMASLQGAFGILDAKSSSGILPGGDGLTQGGQEQLEALARETALLEQLLQEFRQKLQQEGMGDKVAVELEERGIVFRFSDAVLFDVGSAEIRPDAQPVLVKIGEIIKSVPNLVRVEGHTDNWPISTERFPSNWELSTGRAASVVRFLIERCGVEPARLQAAGYGEYHPIDTNETPEGRQRNRRVDVLLLRTGLNLLEPK